MICFHFMFFFLRHSPIVVISFVHSTAIHMWSGLLNIYKKSISRCLLHKHIFYFRQLQQSQHHNTSTFFHCGNAALTCNSSSSQNVTINRIKRLMQKCAQTKQGRTHHCLDKSLKVCERILACRLTVGDPLLELPEIWLTSFFALAQIQKTPL